MNEIDTNALDFLERFDRQQLIDAGYSLRRIGEWRMVHTVYFGATKWTAKQREAKARAPGLNMDQMVLIEKQLRHITDDAQRWKLRLELLTFRGTYEALRRRAKELVPGPPKKKPRSGVTLFAPRMGMRTMMVTGAERDITDIETSLRTGLDHALPESPQMLAPLLDALRSGTAGIPRAVPRPIVLVPLDAHLKVLTGDGDDVLLGLSGGTTMTGADYLQLARGEELEVAVFHPEEGPVNLYRGARFANAKQRDLLRAAQPVCSAPGCIRAADHCEAHHIVPWAHGGETNLDNLAPLCRYHNRVNDDAPHLRKRGRIVRRRGRIFWRSPRGYAVANERGHRGAMDLLFGRRRP